MSFNWRPRPSDVQWTANMLATLQDGGTWVIPHNGSIWKVNKTARTLTCVTGPKDHMFYCVEACCRELKYTAVYKPTPAVPVELGSQFGTGKESSKINRQYDPNTLN